MKKALMTARNNVETLSRQNKRLTELMRTVRSEQRRLSSAKETVMRALAMDESLDLEALNVSETA